MRQQVYVGFFIFVRYTKQIWGVYYIMSWITREANLLKIDRNYSREPMNTINCYFIFVNKNDYIEKISNEHIDVIDGVKHTPIGTLSVNHPRIKEDIQAEINSILDTESVVNCQ